MRRCGRFTCVPRRDTAASEDFRVRLPGYEPRLTPLPAGAAEPLSLMHAACFPDDPWDALPSRSFSPSMAFSAISHGVDEIPAGFVMARDLGGEAEILTLGVLPGCGGAASAGRCSTRSGRRRCGGVSARSSWKSRPITRRRGDSMARWASSGWAARARYYRRGRRADRRADPASADRSGAVRTQSDDARLSLRFYAMRSGWIWPDHPVAAMYSPLAPVRQATIWQAGRRS